VGVEIVEEGEEEGEVVERGWGDGGGHGRY
jgi:hypothetical protein